MIKNGLSASICLVLLLVAGIIMSCSSGGGGDGVTNASPVAEAGPIQNVVTGSMVTLDGSGSSDANGDLLTYSWAFTSKPAGSAAVLSNATVVNPTFTADKDGAYVLRQIVNDGTVDSAADTVTITAATLNSAPVAEAGPIQNVVTGSVVTLDGSGSSDANGDTLTYSWSFTSKPAGSTAVLSSSTVVNSTFTAEKAGLYVLSLIVNDGQVDSTADAVTITARNPCPDTGQIVDYTPTFGEDSDYTIDPPSYTDNGDGTIFDNVTGLTWQKCSVGQNNDATCSGVAATYNWFQATGTAYATYNPGGATNVCGNLNLAGTGWRLPTDSELMSIVHYGTSNPAINTTYFPATASFYYWSSATYAPYTAKAWYVYFPNGYVINFYKTDTNCVRCVR